MFDFSALDTALGTTSETAPDASQLDAPSRHDLLLDGAVPSVHVLPEPGLESAGLELLMGDYYACGSMAGRPCFKRKAAAGASFFLFYEDSEESWWIASELGGEPWVHLPDADAGLLPPRSGWRLHADGRPAGLVALSTREAPVDLAGRKAALPRQPAAPPFRCLLYHGEVYLPYMKPALLKRLRTEFLLRERDICVVSHPRSGTTWLQTIVLHLLHRGRCQKVRDPMREAPWLEASVCRGRISVEELNAQGSEGDCADGDASPGLLGDSRVFKTHASAPLAPWLCAEQGAKLLLATRDPRDTAVSHYHHMLNSSAYRFQGSWADFCQLFLAGCVEGGDFWRWHEGWQERSERETASCLWVRYEDLILDLEGQIRRIAEFLEIDAMCRKQGLPGLADEELRGIVAAVQFKAMRELFDRRNVRKTAKGKRFDPEHIRMGVAGGWPSTMSEQQSRQFSLRTSECRAAMWTVPHYEGGT